MCGLSTLTVAAGGQRAGPFVPPKQRSRLGGMTLRRAFVAGVALLVGGLAFCGASARAQGTPGPIAPKPGGTVQKPPENTIRVKVAEVNAPVAVHDGNGELVLDPQQHDFHVLDSGVEPRLSQFHSVI